MRMPGHRRSFERIVREMWLLAAALVVVVRLLRWTGVFCLLAWSYSVWGSPESPLRLLLVPGIVLLVVSLGLQYLQGRLVGKIYRASHVGGRRLSSTTLRPPAG